MTNIAVTTTKKKITSKERGGVAPAFVFSTRWNIVSSSYSIGWIMARTANPYTKVAKRIKALQIKANKLNDEITALADFVAAESQKTTKPKAKPIAKKASAPKAKKTSAKAKAPPKKTASGKSQKK